MHNEPQFQNSSFPTISRVATVAPAIVFVLALILIFTQSAKAQEYKVLHRFTRGIDGAEPVAKLTRDPEGNFYGTANNTVFKLTNKDSGWVFSPLYVFHLGYDGYYSASPVTIGPDGTLYGTTYEGGNLNLCGGGGGVPGCGVVYSVRPAPRETASALAFRTETVLHAFSGPPNDGSFPLYGALIFDPSGNLYGTTSSGTVFELTPSGSGWTETILYNFHNWPDGSAPYAGVVMDQAGNLYGTTSEGGTSDVGTVYQLSPTQNGWVETVLHSFQGGKDDGEYAYGGLVMDQAGNLYGATFAGGSAYGSGVVYELSPSEGGWTYTILYRFSGGGGPYDALTLDAAGNLYGTAVWDGANDIGMVFKLTQSNGTWTLTDLHDFSSDSECCPQGGVTFDLNGNLYGTAQSAYGQGGWGVVWEIMP